MPSNFVWHRCTGGHFGSAGRLRGVTSSIRTFLATPIFTCGRMAISLLRKSEAYCAIGTRVGPSGGLSLHRPADEVEEGVRPSVRCPRYGRRTNLSNQLVVWSFAIV